MLTLDQTLVGLPSAHTHTHTHTHTHSHRYTITNTHRYNKFAVGRKIVRNSRK